MGFLMQAVALLYNAEGLEKSKVLDTFNSADYLELTTFYFNPKYIDDVTPHKLKTNYCFVRINGEQFTINESASEFSERVNQFMLRNTILN